MIIQDLKVSCAAKGQVCKYLNVCLQRAGDSTISKFPAFQKAKYPNISKIFCCLCFRNPYILSKYFKISSVADGREYGGCCQRGNPAVWTRRVMSSKVLLRRKMLQSRFDLLISFQGICRGPDLTFISYLPKKCCGADLILTSYSKMLGLIWC